MPMVDADWSVDEATGNIRYIGADHGGAPTYATVLEFHRWLMDKADDATWVGNDEMDISVSSPSDRSTDNIIELINGFNIDDGASEHLYDGSITQTGGAEIYDGIVNFGNTSNIQIIQNGAVLTDDWWNSNGGLNADAAAGISHRFMIKVRTGGADIDGRRLLGTSRNFNSTYSEFSINGSTRGNNVLALSEATDLNNATASGTVATWTDIVNDNEGYSQIDANGDSSTEDYYSDWEFGTRSVNNFYERAKYLTREGTAETLYGLNGELFRGITHEIDVDTPTGTFVEPESLSWGSGATAGTGQLLAIDSTTAPTKLWMQLLTGVIPTDNEVITGNGGATCQMNVTITSRPLSNVFVGQSTGSAIIGAYGLGIGADDLTSSDLVFDLTNTQRQPPNNVTFTVSGLEIGEDRVLVTADDGSGGLDYDQLALNGALTTDNVTSVVVTPAIPLDTPSSGTIRVLDDKGLYRRLEYSSYTGSTFTITTTDGNEDFLGDEAASANNVFISYIDKLATATSESFTGVYQSDRDLFVRVRDGDTTPIKPFETTGTLGNAGGSATAIRTTDE